MKLETIVSKMLQQGKADQQHAWGAFTDQTLEALERVLPAKADKTLETGCGKSTILFSNIAQSHLVFAFDDRICGDQSSVHMYENHPMTKHDRIKLVPGPTQLTLPRYDAFEEYDIIMLDGPHGCPFVELEYYYTYPHLRKGGFLVLDDVHLPSVGQFADVLKEDDMFEYHALVQTTLVLRRTDAATFDPLSDSWEKQAFNRRRIPADDPYLAPYHLDDGGKLLPMAQIIARQIAFEDILDTSQPEQTAPATRQAPKVAKPANGLHKGLRFTILGQPVVISGRIFQRRIRWVWERITQLLKGKSS